MITTVTQNRSRIFEDFYAARRLVTILREEELRGSQQTLAYVVMPDHLHWLTQLQHGSISNLVGRVKSLSARNVGRAIWQDGFHDHALRREEDLLSTARYIVANPLRAGLVKHLGEYPHWDAVWL
jgi:REP element-mobilizing transposase RayT